MLKTNSKKARKAIQEYILGNIVGSRGGHFANLSDACYYFAETACKALLNSNYGSYFAHNQTLEDVIVEYIEGVTPGLEDLIYDSVCFDLMKSWLEETDEEAERFAKRCDIGKNCRYLVAREIVKNARDLPSIAWVC